MASKEEGRKESRPFPTLGTPVRPNPDACPTSRLSVMWDKSSYSLNQSRVGVSVAQGQKYPE